MTSFCKLFKFQHFYDAMFSTVLYNFTVLLYKVSANHKKKVFIWGRMLNYEWDIRVIEIINRLTFFATMLNSE